MGPAFLCLAIILGDMSKGFFNLGDGITKGKGLDALKGSRSSRANLIAYFGGIPSLPSSIMVAKKAKISAERDAPGASRTYTDVSSLKKVEADAEEAGKKISKKVRAMARISGAGSLAGALSTFWQDVGRTCILLYSKPGDTVVDPFAGHNSRMELCVRAGRHYVGQDLSHEFMDFNRKRAAELRADFSEVKIELHEGDSRKLQYKSNIGDMGITSPPYWDIEYYGPEAEQMSNTKTYREFIESMQPVMDEHARTLKAGAHSAWFINDFRKDGIFYNYHGDIIRLGKRAGLIQHDIMIVDLGRAFGDVFINQYVEARMLPKRHEYAVILKKPTDEDMAKREKAARAGQKKSAK